MTCSSYAYEWPGQRAWKTKHRHHRPGWLFAQGEGGPTPEDLHRLEHLIGRGPGGPHGPFGRGPRGRGRVRRGDVRLAILRLLADEPRNGYGLMQTIEVRSEGLWRPSPGSVYPTLAQLEDEGLIASSETGGQRQFELTEAGREHLASRSEEPDPWSAVTAAGGGKRAMAELGPLVFAIGQAVWQVASVADEAQRAKAAELLTETRRGLYRILAEEAPAEE